MRMHYPLRPTRERGCKEATTLRRATALLMLCVGVALVMYGCVPVWSLIKRRPEAVPTIPNHPAANPTPPLGDPAPSAPETAEPAVPPAASAPLLQPGMSAALAAAQAAKPGWAAVVHNHNADWSTVELLVGPAEGDWRTGLNYRWTFRGYELVSEGPLSAPAPPTVVIERKAPPTTVIVKERPASPQTQAQPQTPVASSARSGQKTIPVSARQGAARATARRQFSGPSAQTKILSVTSEWESVKVQVIEEGQPVGIVNLSWNDATQSYDITGVDRF